MTSLWVRIRDVIERECDDLKQLLEPLEAELKEVAEQDLKEIAAAGLAAAVASLKSANTFTLVTLELALIAGARAALATAAVKGLLLTGRAAQGVAELAGLNDPPEKKQLPPQ